MKRQLKESFEVFRAKRRGYKAEVMASDIGSHGVGSAKGFESLARVITSVSKRELRSLHVTIA